MRPRVPLALKEQDLLRLEDGGASAQRNSFPVQLPGYLGLPLRGLDTDEGIPISWSTEFFVHHMDLLATWNACQFLSTYPRQHI